VITKRSSKGDIPLPNVILSDYDFDTTLERLRLKHGRYLETTVDVSVKQRDECYASFEFRVNDVSVFGAIRADEVGESVTIFVPDFLTIAPVRSSLIYLAIVFVFLISFSVYLSGFSVSSLLFAVIIWLVFLPPICFNFFIAHRRFLKVLKLVEETVSVVPKKKRA